MGFNWAFTTLSPTYGVVAAPSLGAYVGKMSAQVREVFFEDICSLKPRE